MLTGFELEQPERPCCSNVLSALIVPSTISVFPMGSYCAALLHGGHACIQSCNLPVVTLRRKMSPSGILSELKAIATVPAKAEERRMILMSPVGDQPWSQTVFCLQDLKNDTRDWQSRLSSSHLPSQAGGTAASWSLQFSCSMFHYTQLDPCSVH